jgi:hypothetical protein
VAGRGRGGRGGWTRARGRGLDEGQGEEVKVAHHSLQPTDTPPLRASSSPCTKACCTRPIT